MREIWNRKFFSATKQPFLSPVSEDVQSRCVLCDEIGTNFKSLSSEVLISLKTIAERWSKLDSSICCDPPYCDFKRAKGRLERCSDQVVFAHGTCKITFRNRIRRKESMNLKIAQSSCSSESSILPRNTPELTTPSKISRYQTKNKFACFVCNITSSVDHQPFNDGGLGRCSESRSAAKLVNQMHSKLRQPEDKLHDAALRLHVLLSGASHDIFAADIYYHKLCYNKFVYCYTQSNTDEQSKKLEDEIVCEFLDIVEDRVVRDKEAFFLSELVKDACDLSEEPGGSASGIPYKLRHTFRMKDTIAERFGSLVDFHLVGRNTVVYPKDVNPLSYSIATLQGRGMRDDDIVASFAKLVRRKFACRKKDEQKKWPPELDNFMTDLENHTPISCVYNAISLSINPLRRKNSIGLMEAPSGAQAGKIAALCHGWEMLLGNSRPPLNAALSLTLHRLTGSKESTTLLHHSGIGISYSDVRTLNNTWASTIRESYSLVPPGFISGRSVHVTLDNSDGRQQTLTGTNTTHHTTGTIFQSTKPIALPAAQPENAPIVPKPTPDLDMSYKIPKKRPASPSFPQFSDSFKKSEELENSFKRNICFVLVAAKGEKCILEHLPDANVNNLQPIGSWTCFMRNITDTVTYPCKLKYLPVIPASPSDNVVKYYMESLLQIIEELHLDHIFVPADEAINSKLLIISWLEDKRYDKIVPLMGGFHTLLMFLKIMYKKYACLGFREWWVDAGVIAEGSVDQALEGRHYFRAMRLHKETFEALVRVRLQGEDIFISDDLGLLLANLRKQPGPETLESVLKSHEFSKICRLITTVTGSESEMVISYLRDVSILLSMVGAVRENCIEKHMAAERAILPMCFAFGHIHYSRYLTFQHVRLEQMKQSNHPAWKELVEDGFGGSRSGEPFSAMHGDLITETTINREVKVRGGPMQGGYSTNNTAVQTYIQTSHIMAKIRSTIKQRLDVLTTSAHKESSVKSKSRHEKLIASSVNQLASYFNPFKDGPARNLTTGVEIEPEIIADLLGAKTKGEHQLSDFIEKRLKTSDEDRDSIFDKIKKTKIKTGLEKKKKDPKVVNILKEDRQAFGSLVGSAMSPLEAHSYPLTSIPLALANPDGDLRQGSKASLRNYIIDEANAWFNSGIFDAHWIIDGMAIVNLIQPSESWGQFAKSFVNFCLPPMSNQAQSVSIIFDSYSAVTIKQLTQTRRGEAGHRIHISNKNQRMPKGREWERFLHSRENKSELISFLFQYILSDDVKNDLPIPLLVTKEEETWTITSGEVEKIADCNHQEADTRLVLCASQKNGNVVIRAADTDVLILMVYVFSKLKPSFKWYLKVDASRYADISKIHGLYGDEVCNVLPAYHSITGCDTTSFPYRVGKVKPLKKIISLKKACLLAHLGSSAQFCNYTADAKLFVQTIMYPGKSSKSFVETRMRQYDKQKIKSSAGLCPDGYSTDEHLKRSDLQCFIWRQCLSQNIGCQFSTVLE